MFDKLPGHMFAWISMCLAKKTKKAVIKLSIELPVFFEFCANYPLNP